MGKNIFATITHVAEKITEAITGHKNDEQAHPNLSEQINGLSGQTNSNGKQSLLPSNYLKKFLANHWDNIDGYNSSIIGFGGHGDASVPPFELIGNDKGLHYRIAVADGSKNEWQPLKQLATSDQINEYIGNAFISEEILLDATYPIAYCGSVVNSSTMPNTGQFRVQYIPYFANNEGYSVQIAWGVVTNSGLWYRMANGTRWERWENFSTTTKTDILCTEATGYTMLSQSNEKINNIMYYSLRLQKSDGSNFTQGTQITIGTMPIGAIPPGKTQYGYGSIFSDGSVTGAYCSVAFHPNGNIYVNPNGVGKYIVISGVVVL